ncbi:Cobalt-zinc-cadmium resistance protein CzcA [hydrothermal vent metagenome]|uniref:Cobalt-zinc-cadmium resistance protein CzcA n=1 Tax=hydrothermal vent metagenome TaxID=652676 RepID=A0A3B0R435_9ZZZZ
MKRGISGTLTATFINSLLTPLLLFASLVLGLIALNAIPREEEPQISVPLIDIHVSTQGLKAVDAVELVTKPLETIVKAIDGVEHVYSSTREDNVLVTARFLVGTDADAAILRVHEKIRANINQIPVAIPEPLIVGRSINDVPILVLSLYPATPENDRIQANELYKIADSLRAELIKIDDVGLTFITGGQYDQIRVEPDPEKLSLYGITLQQLLAKIEGANRSFTAGSLRDSNQNLPVSVGQTLYGDADIGLLLLTSRDGRPVYVSDVANLVVGFSQKNTQVWQYPKATGFQPVPAVSIALAKRKGANAVEVATQAIAQLQRLKGTLIPASVGVEITRNYGASADEKANELLFHLGLATISIVFLITIVIGWREGLVVLVVIPTTILLTLFASYVMGYTINRVSLFALIFSIGILVDDAIVVIENISRHWAMQDGRSRNQAAIDAVAEVGNPTIIATMTVVVALLPMLFVSGLMGPYMAPIPVNASAAMIFSFFVAMTITPWLMRKIAAGRPVAVAGHDTEGALGKLYRKIATPLLGPKKTAWIFLILVGVLTVGSTLLFVSKSVTVKLLPFDNKSEFQVMLDLPEGSSLAQTNRILGELVSKLAPVEEITSIQSYAGTSAPFNFNGLVRHYYLRQQPELGDLQVNLKEKKHRKRVSHEIALEARELLTSVVLPAGSSLKIVEIPPGPPVIATLLAEVYGPDPQTRRNVAMALKQIFKSIPYVVDIDDSMGQPAPRIRMRIDQESLEFFKVEQRDVYATIDVLLNGTVVGYSHRGEGRDPAEIAVALPRSALAPGPSILSTPVPSNVIPGERGIAELGDVIKVSRELSGYPVFRRDGRFAEMVMGELAGEFEAPIYGMMAIDKAIKAYDWEQITGAEPPDILLHGQPDDESKVSILWDGEWEITYVTFRDMGAAFLVAILGIYFLVVGQFGSFRVPLVILIPVPLTLIGIMFGHWIFGAPFTATSMIGFIALAGIIVRNSILLVDFIRNQHIEGQPLRVTLLNAGAIRFKPILLTALAAMIGAVVILSDPIFQGLAISLLFGLASSTLLTVLVIPAVYIIFKDDGILLEQNQENEGRA